MEASLEQRVSENGVINEEAVGIVQSRLKLWTTDLVWKLPGLRLLDWFNI